ncbi:Protein yippee-like [Arachis hypogaea]|nr:Protein yippee-like [Arachis hypogaea]
MAKELENKVKETLLDDDFILAANYYSEAINLDPNNSLLYADRAQAHFKLQSQRCQKRSRLRWRGGEDLTVKKKNLYVIVGGEKKKEPAFPVARSMAGLTDADSATPLLLSLTTFSLGVNITLGPQEERMMMSGWHTVEDIFCCCCGQLLGWKYVVAHDKNQRFKEGKSVLERWRIAHDAGDELNLDARAGSSDSENS